MNLIKFEKKKLKNKDFPWYPGLRFEPWAQKQKLLNTEILQNSHNTKIWECSFKKQLRCSSNHINLKMIKAYSGTTYLSFKSF